MSKISAIILDWAGTTVDFGSFAPVDAFMTAFAAFGLSPTMDETRAPMGMQKRAHIKSMLSCQRLAAQWIECHGKPHTQTDIDLIYEQFEPALFAVLTKYANPIPGVLPAVQAVRAMGIKIGSTTGYTRAMMDVVAPLAAANGYAPDCLVCPDETGGVGRPYPYMLWRNLEQLGVTSIAEVLKVGDTVADIQEGKNARCLCAGVISGSSMLGITQEELASLYDDEQRALFERTKSNYLEAGADFVLHDISALPELIEKIGRINL